MSKSNMKPSTLTIILRVAVFTVIVATSAGFYFIQNDLRDSVLKNSQKNTTTSADSPSPEALQQVRNEIAKVQAYGDKAVKIYASAADYQSSITTDLNKYAASTGVSISDFNYSPSVTAGQQIDGLNPNYITIKLKSPLSLNNLLQFLKSIETNLPKMSLTGINITPVAGSSTNVNVEPLTIEVYTK